MKTALRAATVLLTIALVIAAARAALLYRMATMAQAWCGLDPGLPFPSLFSTDSFTYSAHGVAADTVFLRVSYAPGDDATIRERILSSPGIRSKDCLPISLPLPDAGSAPCSDDGQVFRINPRDLLPQRWPSCYGVADRFDIAQVRRGEAWQIIGSRGGLVVLDTGRHRLYVVAYRTI